MVTNFILSYSRLEKFDDVGQIFKLIRLFRGNECLWNLNSAGYNNLTMRENAWNRINKLFGGEFTVDQMKLQMKSLREYYHTERAIMEESALSGKDYVPRHSYYYELDFLSTAMPLKEPTVVNTNLNEEQQNRPVDQPLNFSTSVLSHRNVPSGMCLDDWIKCPTDKQEMTSPNATFESVPSSVPNTVSRVSFSQPTASSHRRVSSGNETYGTQGNRLNNAHYKLCIIDNRCIKPTTLGSNKLYSGGQEAAAHKGPGNTRDAQSTQRENNQGQQESVRARDKDMKYFNHGEDQDMQYRDPSVQPLQINDTVSSEKCMSTDFISYNAGLRCDDICYGVLPQDNMANSTNFTGYGTKIIWPDTAFNGLGVMSDYLCTERTESMETPNKNVNNMTISSTSVDTQINRFVTHEELLACRNYIGNPSAQSKYDTVDQYSTKVCTNERLTKTTDGRSQLRDNVASLVKGRSKERSQSVDQTFSRYEKGSTSRSMLNLRSNSVRDNRRNRAIVHPIATRITKKRICECDTEPTMQMKTDQSLNSQSKNKKKFMKRTSNSQSALQPWSHLSSQQRGSSPWKRLCNVLRGELLKIKDHQEEDRQEQERQKGERFKKEQQKRKYNEQEMQNRLRQSLPNSNYKPRGHHPKDLKEYDECECAVPDKDDAKSYEYEHQSDESTKVVIVKPKKKKRIICRSDVETLTPYVLRPSQPKCVFDMCKCESDVLVAVLPKSENDLPKTKQPREQQKLRKTIDSYKYSLSEEKECCDCNDHDEIAGQKSTASQKLGSKFYAHDDELENSHRQGFSVMTRAQRTIIADNNIQKGNNFKNNERLRKTLSRSDVSGCDCDVDDVRIERGNDFNDSKSNMEIEYYIDVRSASATREMNHTEDCGCCMCNNGTDFIESEAERPFRGKELARKKHTNYETRQINIQLIDCKRDSDQTDAYNTTVNKSEIKNEKDRVTSGMTSLKYCQLVEKCCQCNLNGKIESFKASNEGNRLKQTKVCRCLQRNSTKNSPQERNLSCKCIRSKRWRVGAENDYGMVARTSETNNNRLKSKNKRLYFKYNSDNEGEKRNGRYSVYEKKTMRPSSLGKSKTYIPKRKEKESISDSDAKGILRLSKTVAKGKLSKTKTTKKQNAPIKRGFNDNPIAKNFKGGKAFMPNIKKSKKRFVQPSEEDCESDLYQETEGSSYSDEECDYFQSDIGNTKQIRSLSNREKNKFNREKYYECDSDNNCGDIKCDFVYESKEIRRLPNKENKKRRRSEYCECDPKIECEDCQCDLNSYKKPHILPKTEKEKRGRANDCQCEPKLEYDGCRCDFHSYKSTNRKENKCKCDSYKKHRQSLELEKAKTRRRKDFQHDPNTECDDCRCELDFHSESCSSSEIEKEKRGRAKNCEYDSKIECKDCRCSFDSYTKLSKPLEVEKKKFKREKDCECDPKIECSDYRCDFQSSKKPRSSSEGEKEKHRRKKDCECDPKIECNDCRCYFDSYKKPGLSSGMENWKRGRAKNCECDSKIECEDCRCYFDSYTKPRLSLEVEKKTFIREKDCECDSKIECDDCQCNFESSKKPRSSSEAEKEKHRRKKDCECDPKIHCNNCRCDFESSKKPRSSSEGEKEKHRRKKDCDCDPKIECEDCRCAINSYKRRSKKECKDCDSYKELDLPLEMVKEKRGRAKNCECDSKIECEDCRCDFGIYKKPGLSSEVEKEKFTREKGSKVESDFKIHNKSFLSPEKEKEKCNGEKDCECDIKIESDDCKNSTISVSNEKTTHTTECDCDSDSNRDSPYNPSSNKKSSSSFNMKRENENQTRNNDYDSKCYFDNNKNPPIRSSKESTSHTTEKNCECACDSDNKQFRISSGSSKNDRFSSKMESYRRGRDCECDPKIVCDNCIRDFGTVKKLHPRSNTPKEIHMTEEDHKNRQDNKYKNIQLNSVHNQKSRSPSNMKKEKYKRGNYSESESRQGYGGHKSDFGVNTNFRISSNHEKKPHMIKKSQEYDPDNNWEGTRNNFNRNSRSSSNNKTENRRREKDWESDSKVECDDRRLKLNFNKNSYPHTYMEAETKEIVSRGRRLSSNLQNEKLRKNESVSRKRCNEITCANLQKSDLNSGRRRESCKCTFKDEPEVCICGFKCECKNKELPNKKIRVTEEFCEDRDEFPTDQEEIFTGVRKKGLQEPWGVESAYTSEMSQICCECDSGQSNNLTSYREIEAEDYDKMDTYANKIRQSKKKNPSKLSKKTPKDFSRGEMQSEYEKFKILMETFLKEQKQKSNFSSRREKSKWNSDSECDYQAECVCKVLNFEKYAGTNFSKSDSCSDESQEENERDYKYYRHEDKNQMLVNENLEGDYYEYEEEEVKPQKSRGIAYNRREANIFKTEKSASQKNNHSERKRQILKNHRMPLDSERTKQSGSSQHKLIGKMGPPKTQEDLAKQTNEERSRPTASYRSNHRGLRNTKPVHIKRTTDDELINRVCCLCKDHNEQKDANAEYKRRQRSSSQSNRNTLGLDKKNREASLSNRYKEMTKNTKDHRAFTQKIQSNKVLNADQRQRISGQRDKERNLLNVDESSRVPKPLIRNVTKKRHIPNIDMLQKEEILKESGSCSDVCSCGSDIEPANEVRHGPTRGMDTTRRQNHADKTVKKTESSTHSSVTEKDNGYDGPKQHNQSEPIDVEVVSEVEREPKPPASDVESSSDIKKDTVSKFTKVDTQKDWNAEKNSDCECLSENDSQKNFGDYKEEQIRWVTPSGIEVNGSEWEFCQCDDSQGCLCGQSGSQSKQAGQQEFGGATYCKCNCVATNSQQELEEPLLLNDKQKQDSSLNIHELKSTSEACCYYPPKVFNNNGEKMSTDIRQHGNLDSKHEYEYNDNVNGNATSDETSVIYKCAQINDRSREIYCRRRSIFQRLLSKTSKKCNSIVDTVSAATRKDLTKTCLMGFSTRYTCSMQRNQNQIHKDIFDEVLKNRQSKTERSVLDICNGNEIPLDLSYPMLGNKCPIITTNVEVKPLLKVEANSLEDVSKKVRSQNNQPKLEVNNNGRIKSSLSQTKNQKTGTQGIESGKVKRFLTLTDTKPKGEERRLPSLIKPITVATESNNDKLINPNSHEFSAKYDLPVPPSKNTKIKTCQCFATMPPKVKIAIIKKPKLKNIQKKPVFKAKRFKKGVSGGHSGKAPKKKDLRKNRSSGGSILSKNPVDNCKNNDDNDAVILVLRNDMSYNNLKIHKNISWGTNIQEEVPSLQYNEFINRRKILPKTISVELQCKKKEIIQNEPTVTISTQSLTTESEIKLEVKAVAIPTNIKKSVEDFRTQLNTSGTKLLAKSKEFLKDCKSGTPSCSICTTTNCEVEVEKPILNNVSEVIGNKNNCANSINTADLNAKPKPMKSAMFQKEITAKCSYKINQKQEYATPKRPFDAAAKVNEVKNMLHLIDDSSKEVKVLYSPPYNWRASRHSMMTTMVNCVQAEEREESRRKPPPVKPKPQLKKTMAMAKTTTLVATAKLCKETLENPKS